MNPRLIIATLIMCMALIHASAIMHLSNVGMGSPDWPASYGLIGGGGAAGMEAGKAHTVVSAITPSTTAGRVHRAVANILQLLIIAVVFSVFLKRKSGSLRRPLLIPMLALILSLFLAFLGAWYGSPLRYPWIMMINLTGGIGLLALFWWLTLDIYARPAPLLSDAGRRLKPWAIIGLLIVAIQITLGAWTDAYYAALACTGLPGCAGVNWSGSDFLRGFGFLGSLDVDASGKVITDHAIAASIHMTHRIMALITALFTGLLAWRAILLDGKPRIMGITIFVVLAVQMGLGLAMIHFSMPVTFVVAHTVTAALLVLAILNLIHQQAYCTEKQAQAR